VRMGRRPERHSGPILSEDLKARLDHQPEVYLSPASVGEVAIKQAMGKLTGPADLAA
jgi:PIN domain nuclease of toxin-antitoxin system